jgi:hypothetical protein
MGPAGSKDGSAEIPESPAKTVADVIVALGAASDSSARRTVALDLADRLDELDSIHVESLGKLGSAEAEALVHAFRARTGSAESLRELTVLALEYNRGRELYDRLLARLVPDEINPTLTGTRGVPRLERIRAGLDRAVYVESKGFRIEATP